MNLVIRRHDQFDDVLPRLAVINESEIDYRSAIETNHAYLYLHYIHECIHFTDTLRLFWYEGFFYLARVP